MLWQVPNEAAPAYGLRYHCYIGEVRLGFCCIVLLRLCLNP